MMEWLLQVLGVVVAAVAGALLGWLDRKARETGVIDDAKTPQGLRDAWGRWLSERLRSGPRNGD